ncbi:MAG: ABC1 kinase family protein [Adlercreutzia equolifaciens]|jgi:ubiquinone biosynthesis protein|uniref:ABC transporter n=3 Tax=Adlercreutzia TaxID=447020 RepID=A0A369P586_9ACTN|nr:MULTISPECIES: AarF/UbiB family protein [Adlercreutzia]MBS5740142.1 AarF/ABC1/UbiB kinase family protein [Adlercreutzia equolifaciens]MCB6759330.1 AarF/ABC1/UbiB kinase family protein [Adlercreutzia equolifaciens]MCB6975060.1 AarF/ABC1/UbiB kinase family protein [Adlercreutzia equolifaciens]MDE8683473.1 AarF/UbiB family protein [Adlercreutzia rubneri]MDR3995561.1 AarF/UbiB family protein [Adlercreutzia sp.]
MATFEEFMKVAEISIKDKTSHKRMNEIVRIMRQYKVLHGLTPEQAVEVLQALGPTYVKIGQLASNRSDLLPKAYCDAFEKLRDDANPMPFDVVIEQIDRAYGKSWHEVFASIDPVPLGAASIAQVHKATLLDGTTVAVKVRRPGVAESMAEDIMLMKHLLALGEFASNSHRDILLSLEGFIEEIERTTASEVDFTSELHNLMRFHDELADEEGVTSPVAYPQYSCESVLVMEFVQGTEISHTQALREQGIDVSALARRVCQSYVTQVLDDGFFHADPHPGNILVRDGEVVWIDLGMVGTLTVSERMLVGKVFTAVATDNAYLLKEAVMGLVHVLGPVDHGALLEALSRLLAEYSTAEMKEINVGTVLTEVIEVLRGQNMMMTSSVTMLARGFVTIEGVIAQVAPDISVIEIVSKHVIAQQADPKFLATQLIDLATTSAASAEALAKLPTQLSNTLEMLDRGQIKVNGDIEVSSRILATAYASVGRISLALLSAGLFLGSSILCTTAMQPQLLGVPLLGVLGYVGAFVLGAYTVFHILVSRHRLLNNEEPR